MKGIEIAQDIALDLDNELKLKNKRWIRESQQYWAFVAGITVGVCFGIIIMLMI